MAMEFCWLQAMAAFLFHWAFKYRTPVGFVILIYVCGMISYRFSSLRPRLRIQTITIHLIGFGAAVYMSTWLFLFRTNEGHLPCDLSHLINVKHSLPFWGFLVILLAVSITVWRRSKAQVTNPVNPQNIYQRFDLGLALFFSLLVVKLFCFARFGVALKTPDLRFLFLPYFLFGLLNIGLILNSRNPHRNYAAGFQKIGVALSFIMVMLCISLGMVLLFHGHLISMAENLSGVLKKAGPPPGGRGGLACSAAVGAWWKSRKNPDARIRRSGSRYCNRKCRQWFLGFGNRPVGHDGICNCGIFGVDIPGDSVVSAFLVDENRDGTC